MIVPTHDWRARVWLGDRRPISLRNRKPWRAMLEYGYMVRRPDDPTEWRRVYWGQRKYRGVKKFATEKEATEWAEDAVLTQKARVADESQARRRAETQGEIITVDVDGMPTIDVAP